jgi:NAD(P)H dehydrogenase (quinone)
MSIVVTGATGHLGTLVIDKLLGALPADEVVAAVRNPQKAAPLAERGVTLRIADYDDPSTLTGAFEAGDVVLLISGNEVGRRVTQHTAVIDAAVQAGVARLAYTSILGGPAADFSLAAEHQATEQAILDSGLTYTFLRHGWYTENYTDQIAVQLEHGLVGSAGDGRVGSATRADFAAADAAALIGDGHEDTAYELSGDTAWTLTEYADELSRQSGRDIAYTEVPPEVHRKILLDAGVPEPMADILVDVDVSGIARGLLAGGTGDLSRLIGRSTTPLTEAMAAALEGWEPAGG